MEKRYQVFVSSTFADLQEERANVIQTLMEMDCIPAGMELFPAMDDDQLSFIKSVINDCDYYILIIGNRYGSEAAEGISYTEAEYDYAIAEGLPVLAFIHSDPDMIPVKLSDTDPLKRQKLEAFREKAQAGRLVKMWTNPAELPALVAKSLHRTIKILPRPGWVRGNAVASEQSLEEINELRKENMTLHQKVTEMEAQSPPEIPGLAPVTRTFDCTITWELGQTFEDLAAERLPHLKRFTACMSWADYFAIIAPRLVNTPSDSEVNWVLAQAIFHRYVSPDVAPGTLVVQSTDFDTIRLQLRALNLIEWQQHERANGATELYWGLTHAGQRLMFDIRTIKA